ncbi:hypothetical protein F5Y12DRAFT_512983 [Xylaria sp. FL1777]|nr:hypothetical protein F5Y12DRAFT_512983 [Xylaria sp. FL1777]
MTTTIPSSLFLTYTVLSLLAANPQGSFFNQQVTNRAPATLSYISLLPVVMYIYLASPPPYFLVLCRFDFIPFGSRLRLLSLYHFRYASCELAWAQHFVNI